MTELSNNYLTKKQACEKYSFLTENMLKNLIFTNPGGFRDEVVRKLGRRVFLDEQAFLRFIANSK